MENDGWKLGEGADDSVRPQVDNWNVGITEVDRNNRYVCGASGPDVRDRITDHNRAFKIAAGAHYSRPKDARIGLLNTECVLATNRREAVGDIELRQEFFRQPFE